MKVGIYTLGCKVNLYESEFITGLFKEKGYTISSFDEPCDIYVINTCTVTNNSDSKSRKMINHIKNNYPDSILVVCGCYIESNKFKDIDGIDIVVGNYNKSKIVEKVEEYLKLKKQIVEKYDINKVPFEDMVINDMPDKTRAFVKIQDGCENFCTYCIIPYVRGKCRSKNPDVVIDEITCLVNKGYKEIVLTGIHTGHYGVDLDTSFCDLLKRILTIPNLKRLRISSIEITELNDEFLHILNNPIICDHLHIPLQNGSASILKNMNRKYDKAYFLNKVNEIRKIRPFISLTTDVIVGFPGEMEEDFKECMDFIKRINFSKIHVFPYSKRNGTMASSMPNQVDDITKKRRVKELINLSNELEESYRKSFIGKNVSVLIEKVDELYAYGHTSNYLYIKTSKNKVYNEIYNIIYKDLH